MRDYRKLKVWWKAHELTLRMYQVSREFPSYERFGLSSQLRRAAASIPANIAEGYGRAGDAEFARFLSIAQSSSSELSYHLLLARDLDYIAPGAYEKCSSDLAELQRMMHGLSQKVRSDL